MESIIFMNNKSLHLILELVVKANARPLDIQCNDNTNSNKEN